VKEKKHVKDLTSVYRGLRKKLFQMKKSFSVKGLLGNSPMSAKKPLPRSRPSKSGADSTVPPGFSLETYVTADGKRQAAWRCPALSQHPATGEWRRCSKLLQKAGCLAHLRSGKHLFNIPRADDAGFPAQFQERQQEIRLQRGFDEIHDAMARFAGRANISAREASRSPMIEFVRDIARTAIRLHDASPTFQVASIPPISASSLTRRIRAQGQEAFERMAKDISDRIYFVSLLADSGTVLGFNSVHAMIVNPNYPRTILPLDTFENHRFTADDYEAFFRNAIKELQHYHIELVAIVCDNCPAQLNGVAQALAFCPELSIVHVPCFNHMINLVFTHILTYPPVSHRIEILNEIVSCLLTDTGRQVLGKKCPMLIKTRWVYAVDVLRFILERISDVNTVLTLASRDPVPDCLKTLYWLLLPLKLFSLRMECRFCALNEVLPLAAEVLHEYQYIQSELVEPDDLDILNQLTAHFVARLRINAFEDTVTAWVLSIDGRERIRAQEAHYNSQVAVSYPTAFAPLGFVTLMQEKFRDQFKPWENSPIEPDGGGVLIDVISDELRAAPTPSFDVTETLGPMITPGRATAVSNQRAQFQRILEEQSNMEVSERLAARLDRGAFQMACSQIRHMASALQLNPDEIEARFRAWLFTAEVPDAPTITDSHWREVHSIDEKWVGMARIGVRYASIATSEAEVERLFRERQDVQGMHGVNFGTHTLDARLVLRYET
jgi:hypothetical protein